MATQILTKEIALRLSVGHLLFVWEILANKLSGTPPFDALDQDEKRALWALQDLCEQALVEHGVSSFPDSEWNRLVQEAKAHVRTIPVEFLE